jgi:hypothetical protein
MKLVLTFVVLSLQNSILTQDIDTTFYDAKWKEVNSLDSAFFYSVSEKLNDLVFKISDYYNSTKTIYCQGALTNNIKSGRWTFYDLNGNVIKDYEFTNNGKSKRWYKFDEDSLKPNINGIYLTTNVTPSFVEGMNSFNDYIFKNFELPKKVKEIGIRSFKVNYQLIINEEGKIVDIWDQEKGVIILNEDLKTPTVSEKYLLKIKKELNRKLKKFLVEKTNWIPATVKSVPVKSAKYVSIIY